MIYHPRLPRMRSTMHRRPLDSGVCRLRMYIARSSVTGVCPSATSACVLTTKPGRPPLPQSSSSSSSLPSPSSSAQSSTNTQPPLRSRGRFRCAAGPPRRGGGASWRGSVEGGLCESSVRRVLRGATEALRGRPENSATLIERDGSLSGDPARIREPG